jgi:hypothetical protein
VLSAAFTSASKRRCVSSRENSSAACRAGRTVSDASNEADKLYKAVGQITSDWAQIEDTLFGLFVVAITGKWLVGDLRPYRAAFFSISSYEPKIRMINAALRARYVEKPSIVKEWDGLKSRLNTASGNRNQVAHLVVMNVKLPPLDDGKPVVQILARPMCKSTHAVKVMHPDYYLEGALDVNELAKLHKAWGSLSADLMHFAMRIEDISENNSQNTPS